MHLLLSRERHLRKNGNKTSPTGDFALLKNHPFLQKCRQSGPEDSSASFILFLLVAPSEDPDLGSWAFPGARSFSA